MITSNRLKEAVKKIGKKCSCNKEPYVSKTVGDLTILEGNIPMDFEVSVYLLYRLFPDGKVKYLCQGSKGYSKYKPTLSDKLKLINRILWM